MMKLMNNPLGRLRILGFLEGISLLLLVFIAVPLKYGLGMPGMSSVVGAIHGALFLLFVFNTLSVGVSLKWKFFQTTLKVLVACVIPFGTFYIDRTILRKIKWNQEQ